MYLKANAATAAYLIIVGVMVVNAIGLPVIDLATAVFVIDFMTEVVADSEEEVINPVVVMMVALIIVLVV
jgi:hypothetical protein